MKNDLNNVNGMCRVAGSRNGLQEIDFWDIFFGKFVQIFTGYRAYASIKKLKTGCMVFTSQ